MFGHFQDRPDEYVEVAKTIIDAKNSGVVFYSMHTNKNIGELISRNEDNDIDNAVRLFESNCQYAVQYDVKLLVLHLWGGVPSDKHIDVNIGMYPKLKAIADRYNLLLTVENIVCNTYKPLDHMKKLWEMYPHDIKFTIDVRQAEFHNSLVETCESAFLWENDLVAHLHFSDYGGGYMDWPSMRTPIGLTQGNIDFEYFFSFLKSIGFDGSVADETGYIADSGELVDNLNEAYAFINGGLTR